MVGRPKEFQDEEVLDAVMVAFWRGGFYATGIVDLEKATGLGRQSLYSSFGCKKKLFKAAVDRYITAVIRPGMIDVLDAPGSAIDNLENLFDTWRQAAGSPDFNGCLVGNSVAELGASDLDTQAFLRHKLELMEAAFRRVVERAQAQGAVDPGLHVETASRALLALAQGLAVITRVSPDQAVVDSVIAGARSLLKH